MAIQQIDFHVHLGGEEILNFLKIPCHKFWAKKIPLFDKIMSYFIEIGSLYFRRWKKWNFISIYKALSCFASFEISRRLLANSVKDLIQSMDKNGIKTSVIHSIEPYLDTFRILNSISEYKERLFVFCSVDFKKPDYLERFKNYIQFPSVVGLKLYPAIQRIDPQGVIVSNILQIAHEKEVPVFFHSGSFPFEIGEAKYNDVNLLEPLISQFSTLKIVLGHIGWDQYEKAIKLAKSYKNVFVETSWQPSKIIRKAIDELGVKKVILGSDWPLGRQNSAIEHLKKATNWKEFEQIGCKNAMDLFRDKKFLMT